MLAACEGIIEDPSSLYALNDEASESSSELETQVAERDAAVVLDGDESAAESEINAAADSDSEASVVRLQSAPAAASKQTAAAASPKQEHAAAPLPQAAAPASATAELATRVGTGDLAAPLA